MNRYFSSAFFALCLLVAASVSGCSIPNLESQNCGSAREVVKRFYSYHFGTEISSAPDVVRERESFLTGTLADELRSRQNAATDYFTRTTEPPKTFRAGSCTEKEPPVVEVQVILLWRNDDGSRQEEIRVEVVEIDGKWLINEVF